MKKKRKQKTTGAKAKNNLKKKKNEATDHLLAKRPVFSPFSFWPTTSRAPLKCLCNSSWRLNRQATTDKGAFFCPKDRAQNRQSPKKKKGTGRSQDPVYFWNSNAWAFEGWVLRLLLRKGMPGQPWTRAMRVLLMGRYSSPPWSSKLYTSLHGVWGTFWI